MLQELLLYLLLWLGVISLLWRYRRYQEWPYGEEEDRGDTQRRLDEAVARHNRYCTG
jgi:hypothetical protein